MDSIIENLILIICLPKIVFWCVVFAYEGLFNGSTLTHGGYNSGLVAKIYGVAYSIGALFSLALIPLYSQYILKLDGSTIKQSLLKVEPKGVGFFALGIAVLGFLFKYVINRKAKKSLVRNKYRHKVYDSMFYFIGAGGIHNIIGAPQWVLLCVYAFFVYFGAFMSPKTVIKAMKPNVGDKFVYFTKNITKKPFCK